MKKVYIKPEMEIERFIMDIAFAGSCVSSTQVDYAAGKQWWDEKGGVSGYSSFDDYWNFLTSDDSNSGTCYFTLGTAAFS